MSKKSRGNDITITPEGCLAWLPEIPLETEEIDDDGGLHRAELRRSILAIADLNHVSETGMVRTVVKNALGKLPELEE